MVAFAPVQDAVLVGGADAAGGDLGDVDVDGRVGGGGGGVRGVLADGQGDGGEGDGFAEEPGEALEGEEGVDGIGEGVVLHQGGGGSALRSSAWETRGARRRGVGEGGGIW